MDNQVGISTPHATNYRRVARCAHSPHSGGYLMSGLIPILRPTSPYLKFGPQNDSELLSGNYFLSHHFFLEALIV
jgi:hypothetical protein